MNKLLIGSLVVSLPMITLVANSEEGEGHREHGKHGKRFEKIDVNADGFISMDEMRDFHEQKFLSMDANGDGLLTKEEIKQGRKKRHFDRVDVDNDGFISEEEAMAVKGFGKRVRQQKTL